LKIDSKKHTIEKKFAQKVNLEVSLFFGIPSVEFDLKVYDSQRALAKSWVKHSDDPNAQAPKWIVAFATLNKEIHMLSPKIMPAGHEKTGQDRFNKTIKHEISHLYIDIINKSAPSWLKEGVCLHIAEQDYYDIVDLDSITTALLNDLDQTFTDGRAYNVGKTIVDLIVDGFGKKELFKIIAITDKSDRHNELKKIFSWFN
jgi:hypothetical protein